MNDHVAEPIRSIVNGLAAQEAKESFTYEARYMEADGEDPHIVRLFRKDANNPSDGGEYVGLCAANGPEEGKLIAESINAAVRVRYGAEDAVALVKRMFDWSRFDEAAP